MKTHYFQNYHIIVAVLVKKSYILYANFMCL